MLRFASFVVAFGLITGQALASTLVVNSTADDGSAGTLRYEIGIAQPGDTITFNLPSYPATIQLSNQTITNPAINITKSLNIVGPSSDPSQLTITGYAFGYGSDSDVFDISQPNTPVSNINVSISNLTINGANYAVYSSGYSQVTGITTNVNLQNVVLINSIYAAEFDDGVTGSVSQSTISNNYQGLELYTFSSDPANVVVSQSTVSHNYLGIHNFGGNARIVNSTFFANGNSSNDGFSADANGDYQSKTTFAFSTIDGASANATPGILVVDPTAAVALKSTILADHPAGNCVLAGTTAASEGYNLDSDGTCALSGTGDQSGTSGAPLTTGLAEALASNGGPTQTDALAATGPAIDAIPTSNCTDDQGTLVTTDQRGFTRPSGKGCEVGAFEYQNLSTPISVSLTLSGYPPSAANFNLVASFATNASIDPTSQPVGLQIGAYSTSIDPGSFKQLLGGSKTGSWVYSGVVNGVSLSIQIVNNGNGTYQFKANGGAVNVGTQTPIPVEISIGNFVGTGSNASSTNSALKHLK